MEVEDLMVQKVVTVNADATVREAAKLMNQHEIGCIIAVHAGEMVGIITERDLLRKVLEESKDPTKIRVREIMSKKLVVGTPTMSVTDAARLMLKCNVKKLPIVVDGRLVGIVTLTDIARAARVEPQMASLMKELGESGWLPPKRMQKILDYYIS
ncbi:MAG: cyclic nucleotide-binding/CBS domain-containing protein [Candidatus Bathyarchaeia archaeon]